MYTTQYTHMRNSYMGPNVVKTQEHGWRCEKKGGEEMAHKVEKKIKNNVSKKYDFKINKCS